MTPPTTRSGPPPGPPTAQPSADHEEEALAGDVGATGTVTGAAEKGAEGFEASAMLDHLPEVLGWARQRGRQAGLITPAMAPERRGARGGTWSDLRAELDCWAAAGRKADLWWRDDGASAATRSLEIVIGIAREARLPVTLAVATEALEREGGRDLARAVDVPATIDTVVYWASADAPGAGSSHFTRRLDALAFTLHRLFGDTGLPAITWPDSRPPPSFLHAASETGLSALSALGPRFGRRVLIGGQPAGLIQANVHVPLLMHSAQRVGFPGVTPALTRLIAHLRARRLGFVDPAEATGIMTRHKLMSAAAWDFLAELIATTRGHKGARWIGGRAALGFTQEGFSQEGYRKGNVREGR